MNKIVLENSNLTNQLIDQNVTIKYIDNKDNLDVACLIIDIIGNTNLEVHHLNSEENKINIVINVQPYVKAEVLEYNKGVKAKVKINYNLDINSSLKVFKFNDCMGRRELNIGNLNGENSSLNYYLKTIGTELEKYDLMFYHKAKKTEANIDVDGVSIDSGNIIFNITNVVYKGMINSIVNQNSRIVILNDNKCQINPNLLIDEYEVSANHSAIMGKFSDAEMFYLNSRGISKERALNLLIKGFLMQGFNKDIFDENIILQIIDKYWR